MNALTKLMRVHAMATIKEFDQTGAISAPIWLLENEYGRIVVSTPMPGEDMAVVMRQAIREFGAVRYAFATEGWFLQLEKDEPITERPSQSANRREGIFIHGEDKQGNRQYLSYEIKRPAGGKPVLKKMDTKDADFSGRLSDMFAVGPYT